MCHCLLATKRLQERITSIQSDYLCLGSDPIKEWLEHGK